ncbi:hypothetical protein FQR65_LT02097 [Abscondita terminalis]|nr:hypothetical protein FQR65_LT02097 [Abscondita terminalis]
MRNKLWKKCEIETYPYAKQYGDLLNGSQEERRSTDINIEDQMENTKRARAGLSDPPKHIINYNETNFKDYPGVVKVMTKREHKHTFRTIDTSTIVMFDIFGDGKANHIEDEQEVADLDKNQEDSAREEENPDPPGPSEENPDLGIIPFRRKYRTIKTIPRDHHYSVAKFPPAKKE